MTGTEHSDGKIPAQAVQNHSSIADLILPNTPEAQELKLRYQAFELLRQFPWPAVICEQHLHLSGAVPLDNTYLAALHIGARGVGRSFHTFRGVMLRDPALIKDLNDYLDQGEVFDRIERIQSGHEALSKAVKEAAFHTHYQGGRFPLPELDQRATIFQTNQFELRFNPVKRTDPKSDRDAKYRIGDVLSYASTSLDSYLRAQKFQVAAGLILCFAKERNFDPKLNRILAHRIRELAPDYKHLIGLDIAGKEKDSPYLSADGIRELAYLYDLCGDDMGRTMHWGETRHTRINEFKEGLIAVQPARVGHPLIAVLEYWENGDDSGLKLMAQKDIVAELCLYTYFLEKLLPQERVKDLLNTLDDYGVRYTFSTDSTYIHGVSLAEEFGYLLVHEYATQEQLLRALQVAKDTSFIKTSPMLQETGNPYIDPFEADKTPLFGVGNV